MAGAVRENEQAWTVQSPRWSHALEALHSISFAERVLPEYLRGRRWFGGKAQTLRSVQVLKDLPLGDAGHLILLQANYLKALPETYLLPLQCGEESRDPDSIVAKYESDEGMGVLRDALEDESFRTALWQVIAGEERLCCGAGELVGICSADFKARSKEERQPLHSRVLKVEQSNSSILYGDLFFLKLYRRPEAGENPDAEVLRHITEGQKFSNVPGYCGVIEYREQGAEPRVLALLVKNVPSTGTAWTSTLITLARLQNADDTIGGGQLERARLLGMRTAQMHLALAAEAADGDFAAEAFTAEYRDSLCQSMGKATRRMMQLLEQNLGALNDEAAELLLREQEILRRHATLMERPINAKRIRIHGDYHLGQVLDTGGDFIIIDFEGEPGRPLNERRIKHSPLRDVAGMLRSFDYAAHTAFAQRTERAEAWVEGVSDAFLSAYLATAKGAAFLPASEQELRMLLDACLLEKAVYEVCYELNNRPDWVGIPLRGITRILDRKAGR
ncbi:MAG: putative maltokinase [Verrucomicrobia bacterium]|nr:putative maltokinase [Verrucomicrobiota bacterium]